MQIQEYIRKLHSSERLQFHSVCRKMGKSAKDFFLPNLLLFTGAGIWSPFYYENDLSLRKRVYKCYSRTALTLCILYIVQSCVQFVRKHDELTLDDKSEFYAFGVQLCVGLLKVYFLDQNENKLRQLFKDIEKEPFQRNNDSYFNSKFVERIRANRKIMLLFWIPIFGTLVMKVTNCFFATRANKELFNEMCSQEINGTLLSNSDFDCYYPKALMPWITWFPFETDKSPGNEAGIAYQLFLLSYFAVYIFNFDMYVASWMMYISFQFELMGHDLQTLRYKSEEHVIKEHVNKEEEFVTQEMVRRMRKIIYFHNSVLR